MRLFDMPKEDIDKPFMYCDQAVIEHLKEMMEKFDG